MGRVRGAIPRFVNRLLTFFRHKRAMEIRLHRTENNPDATFGELLINGAHACFTLEDAWRDNRPRVSCIPAGTYEVIPHGWEDGSTVKFKRVWEITGVPGRSAILIHQGNTVDDTVGCVLVGTTLGMIDGRRGILGSNAALNKLRATLPKAFTLIVD